MKKIFLILIFVFTALCCGCGQASEDAEFIIDDSSSLYEDETESLSEDKSEKIVVYVCGQVASPGVYELEEGSRVYKAIEAAGGLLEGADASKLNQAQLLSDGQQITVYAANVSESADAGESEGSGKVNINYATAEELATLPGIGESRAADIIAYREENGNFATIEELTNVSGIKEKTYQKLADLIEV